ncbi:cysteine/histidine-rich C1 domain protein [Senna tora]|uniref:Cysteine/histidine-rich C1 domain protein n=1 Tax=Senna tora TaxID=362788 RepID=A0A834SKH1_9FABA|nr:cysteine/histidine-rich C1 domain protein [Senna tora]
MESAETDLDVFHFSHPHPLELTTSPTTPNTSCFGCNLNVPSANTYYACKSCKFCLHYSCYKLPILTHHPAHSTHDLVLLVIPPSSSAPTKQVPHNCLACGHHVTAFCYHCAQCNIYFHTFCLALPFSISISHHPHNVKLEFSPPYDFFCDLCKKPSYKGWLYRCSLCEFDIHLACAVQNLEPNSIRHPSFSQSNILFKKITSVNITPHHVSSTSVVHEMMRLIAEQIGGGVRIRINGQDDFGSTVIGWDKRVSSPRGSGNKKTKMVELIGTELSPARKSGNLEERTPLRDKLTPLSEGTPSSYQLSEACFSIDLAKSYSGARGVSSATPQVINKGITNRMMSNISEEGKEEAFGVNAINWPSFNSYNDAGQQNRVVRGFGESSHRALKPTNINSDDSIGYVGHEKQGRINNYNDVLSAPSQAQAQAQLRIIDQKYGIYLFVMIVESNMSRL